MLESDDFEKFEFVSLVAPPLEGKLLKIMEIQNVLGCSFTQNGVNWLGLLDSHSMFD